MSDTPLQEQKIASWVEPVISNPFLPKVPLWAKLGTAIGLCLISIAIGIWQQSFSWYLVAAAILSGAFALYTQSRRPASPLEITLSNLVLYVGARSYPLAEISGFWIDTQAGLPLVNIELRRSSLLPISFFYPEPNEAAVRQLLLQVIPEVEARPKTLADSLNHFLGI